MPTPGIKKKQNKKNQTHKLVHFTYLNKITFCFFVSPFCPDNTHHVCDVQDLSGHGFFVVARRRGEPEFLECLIHQFLQRKRCLVRHTVYERYFQQSTVKMYIKQKQQQKHQP